MTKTGNDTMHGLVAEFEDSQSLMAAARATRDAGYKKVRAYTPYHVEGLADVLGQNMNILPFAIPLGLFFGAFMGYVLQLYTSTGVYEWNIAGRPVVSWPAFMPVTFEVAILTAAIVAVLIMFVHNGLPLPYHPIFNTPNFDTASHSRFFLCIEADDKQFNLEETTAFMQDLAPVKVSEVQS
jgi:hypothetical protein